MVCDGKAGVATMLNVRPGGDILLTLGNCDPPGKFSCTFIVLYSTICLGGLKRDVEDNTEFHKMWLHNISQPGRANLSRTLNPPAALGRWDTCDYGDSDCSMYAAGEGWWASPGARRPLRLLSNCSFTFNQST